MSRLPIVLLTLALLGACGGSHRKKCSNSAEPDAGFYDPGDPGYYDPGYDDSGSDDSGSDGGGDGSEEKATDVSADLTVEVSNYDAASYTLYVEAVDPSGAWVKLYFPSLTAAPPVSHSNVRRPIRLRRDSAYSLVLEDPDGRTLDARTLLPADGAARSGFSVIGATLIESTRG